MAQLGVTATILGASNLAQLHDNLRSLDIHLDPKQLRALNEASALEPIYPYSIFTPEINHSIFAGASVQGWAA